jgi:hypothetical protein
MVRKKIKIIVISALAFIVIITASFFLYQYIKNELIYRDVNSSLSVSLKPGSVKGIFPDITQVKSAYIASSPAPFKRRYDYFDLRNKSQRNIISAILMSLNSESGTLKDCNSNFSYNGSIFPAFMSITLENGKSIGFLFVNQPDNENSQNKIIYIQGTYFKQQKTEINPVLAVFIQSSEKNVGWQKLIGSLENETKKN